MAVQMSPPCERPRVRTQQPRRRLQVTPPRVSIEMEARTKETIWEKDEAIKSRVRKISRLIKDLAYEEKRRKQARDDLRRVRGERDDHAARIVTLVATNDVQKAAIAEAEEFKRSAGARRLMLEEKIRNLERMVKL